MCIANIILSAVEKKKKYTDVHVRIHTASEPSPRFPSLRLIYLCVPGLSLSWASQTGPL